MTDSTCKDCRHSVGFAPMLPITPVPLLLDAPMCVHPARKTLDPVHGVVTRPMYCAAARTSERDCGPTARLFEPKLRARLVGFLLSILGGKARV